MLVVFRDLLTSSFNGVLVSGTQCFARTAMCIADQPEQRNILCLKRRDSFMDCSQCKLTSRVTTDIVQQPTRTGTLIVGSVDLRRGCTHTASKMKDHFEYGSPIIH